MNRSCSAEGEPPIWVVSPAQEAGRDVQNPQAPEGPF